MKPMKIDVNRINAPAGHQERESCGPHKNNKDKRTRRKPSTSDLLSELEDDDFEEGNPADGISENRDET